MADDREFLQGLAAAGLLDQSDLGPAGSTLEMIEAVEDPNFQGVVTEEELLRNGGRLQPLRNTAFDDFDPANPLGGTTRQVEEIGSAIRDLRQQRNELMRPISEEEEDLGTILAKGLAGAIPSVVASFVSPGAAKGAASEGLKGFERERLLKKERLTRKEKLRDRQAALIGEDIRLLGQEKNTFLNAEFLAAAAARQSEFLANEGLLDRGFKLSQAQAEVQAEKDLVRLQHDLKMKEPRSLEQTAGLVLMEPERVMFDIMDNTGASRSDAAERVWHMQQYAQAYWGKDLDERERKEKLTRLEYIKFKEKMGQDRIKNELENRKLFLQEVKDAHVRLMAEGQLAVSETRANIDKYNSFQNARKGDLDRETQEKIAQDKLAQTKHLKELEIKLHRQELEFQKKKHGDKFSEKTLQGWAKIELERRALEMDRKKEKRLEKHFLIKTDQKERLQGEKMAAAMDRVQAKIKGAKGIGDPALVRKTADILTNGATFLRQLDKLDEMYKDEYNFDSWYSTRWGRMLTHGAGAVFVLQAEEQRYNIAAESVLYELARTKNPAEKISKDDLVRLAPQLPNAHDETTTHEAKLSWLRSEVLDNVRLNLVSMRAAGVNLSSWEKRPEFAELFGPNWVSTDSLDATLNPVMQVNGVARPMDYEGGYYIERKD